MNQYLNLRAFIYGLPPPAATNVAIDELCKARHKRKGSTHLFVVPRRWTYLWRRKLFRACDFRSLIAAGSPLWGKEEHEPLTVVIFSHFCRYRSWKLRRMPVLLEMTGTVQRLFEKDVGAAGSLLRNFFKCMRQMDYLPAHVVWELLHFPLGGFFSGG